MIKSRAHKLSQYRDGDVWVVFCSICSAEGDKLTASCPGGYIEKKLDKEVDKQTEPS